MKEHDVIRYMGRFPDKIITKRSQKRILSNRRLGSVYGFSEEVGIPAPCSNCGDIFFEKIGGYRNEKN